MLLYFCPTASDSFSGIPGQSFQLLRTCCPEASENMSENFDNTFKDIILNL